MAEVKVASLDVASLEVVAELEVASLELASLEGPASRWPGPEDRVLRGAFERGLGGRFAEFVADRRVRWVCPTNSTGSTELEVRGV